MKKLLLLLPMLGLLYSCSEDPIEEKPAAVVEGHEQAADYGGAIVAYPYPGTISEVYYAGLKVPVSVYNGDEYIIEGDIRLPDNLVTTEKKTLIYEKGDTPPRTKSVGRTLGRWTNSTVYYAIDPALPNQERVFGAIEHWESHTNLKFVERTYQKNYIYFESGSGCSSYVGMIGGRQEVTLAAGCTTGSTIHEIGHAVGLWHEQSRMDRENYIKILYENIEPGMEHNFTTYGDRKMDGAEFTQQLDLGSIMMYGTHDFSRNGQPTIVKLDGSFYGVQRSRLSEGDLAGIHQMYSDDAPTFEVTYRNGNYYVIDGVNVFRMHDKWYFYDGADGWRELIRKEGYWYFA